MGKNKGLPIEYVEYFNLGDMDGENDEAFKKGTFIETNSAKKILRFKKYNYVHGNFGSGKSALVRAISTNFTRFKEETKIVIINEAFSLHSNFFDKDTIEKRETIIPLWSFYIMKRLIDDILRNYRHHEGISNFKKEIANYEILKHEFNLNQSFIDTINNLNIALFVDCSGLPFEFAPKFNINKNPKPLQINTIFKAISDFYSKNNLSIVILIDRVEDFIRNKDTNRKKLHIESLHEIIEELRLLPSIRPILFVRSDIFNQISPNIGSMKLDDRTIKLKWSKEEIYEFIHTRLIHMENSPIKSSITIRQLFDKGKNSRLIKILNFLFKNKIKKNLSIFEMIQDDLYKVFPKEFKSQRFFDYLEEELFPNEEYNPRIIINFLNILFGRQFSYYQDKGLCEIIKVEKNGSYDIFTPGCIEDSIDEIKKLALKNIITNFSDDHSKDIFKEFHYLMYKNRSLSISKIRDFFSTHCSFCENKTKEYLLHLTSQDYFIIDGNKFFLSSLYRIKLTSY